MSTLARDAFTVGATNLTQIGQAIPDNTPPHQLRCLWRRYADDSDSMVSMLPRYYRNALLDRLARLLPGRDRSAGTA